MENRTANIIKARIARIICFTVALIVSIGVLQKISEIPVVEKNVKAKTHSVIDIDIYDPYSYEIYGKMFDVTKTKYKYHIDDFSRFDVVCFNHTTENIEFSPIVGVEESVIDTHGFVCVPDKEDIIFYTHQMLSKQVQTIRIFFLTELIVFLLIFIGNQLINLFFSCIGKETINSPYIIIIIG